MWGGRAEVLGTGARGREERIWEGGGRGWRLWQVRLGNGLQSQAMAVVEKHRCSNRDGEGWTVEGTASSKAARQWLCRSKWLDGRWFLTAIETQASSNRDGWAAISGKRSGKPRQQQRGRWKASAWLIGSHEQSSRILVGLTAMLRERERGWWRERGERAERQQILLSQKRKYKREKERRKNREEKRKQGNIVLVCMSLLPNNTIPFIITQRRLIR